MNPVLLEAMTATRDLIEFGGANDLIDQVGEQIGGPLGKIVSLAGVVFAATRLAKGFKKIHDEDHSGAIQDFVWATIAIILSIISFFGAGDIAEFLNPVTTDNGGENPYL